MKTLTNINPANNSTENKNNSLIEILKKFKEDLKTKSTQVGQQVVKKAIKIEKFLPPAFFENVNFSINKISSNNLTKKSKPLGPDDFPDYKDSTNQINSSQNNQNTGDMPKNNFIGPDDFSDYIDSENLVKSSPDNQKIGIIEKSNLIGISDFPDFIDSSNQIKNSSNNPNIVNNEKSKLLGISDFPEFKDYTIPNNSCELNEDKIIDTSFFLIKL